MKLNTVISGSLVLTVALLCPIETFAKRDHSSIQIKRSVGFERSEAFADLDDFSELDGYNNYADVQLLGTTSDGQVIVVQRSVDSGINKARVILDDSHGGFVYIGQEGSDNTALVEQSGINNRAMMYQQGVGHEGYISQDGDNNLARLVQLYRNGESSSISIDQVNSNNRAEIVDYGGSNYSVEQSGDAGLTIRSSMARSFTIKQ